MRHFVASQDMCFQRTLAKGHITASAWVIDPTRTKTLLTHHRKLNRWLQMGGHLENDASLTAAALREVHEESGLTRLKLLSLELFDVDVHTIPTRPNQPEHQHHDVRFLIEADPYEPLTISDESHDLAWVELSRVWELNSEESILRLVEKTSDAQS